MTNALRIGGALVVLAGLVFHSQYLGNPFPFRWAIVSVPAIVALLWLGWKGIVLDGLESAVLAFLGYAVLSLAWSLDWREGIISLHILFVLAGLFVIVRRIDRDWLSDAVPWGAGIAIVLTLPLGNFGMMGNENFYAEYLSILIPLTVVRVKPFPVLAGLSGIVALAFNGSDTRWMALLGIFGLAWLWCLVQGYRKSCAVVFFVGIAVAVLLWPYLPQHSIFQRLELTYDTLAMWLDYPIFGIGLGGFNYLYPLYQEAHPASIDGGVIKLMSNYAGASHNEFAQALAVFGLVGCTLLAGVAYVGLKDFPNDALSRLGLVSAFALAGVSLVGFPLQNPSTAVVAVIVMAAVCGSHGSNVAMRSRGMVRRAVGRRGISFRAS